MNSDSMMTPPFPSALEEQDAYISPEEVDSPILKHGFAYWKDLRAGREFPARSDITPRGLGSLLRNALLLRVIDRGEDYEYRIVGDAHVLAHGVSVQGKLWSQVNNSK
ncbi:MAG TPA: PAS domain-containing protein, partial [Rhizomicrobium sp.]